VAAATTFAWAASGAITGLFALAILVAVFVAAA
jgi:hypothetical protein